MTRAQKKRRLFRKQLVAAIALACSSLPAGAATVSVCNDAGDTCIVHKVEAAGSLQNPFIDDYPPGYRPGWLHAGLYCAAGNWHEGWLMPWERAPVIKRSCGRGGYD